MCNSPADMVRSAQSTTFSASTYFDDRGPHGTAQPITEYVNVSPRRVETNPIQAETETKSPTRVQQCPTFFRKASVNIITGYGPSFRRALGDRDRFLSCFRNDIR